MRYLLICAGLLVGGFGLLMVFGRRHEFQPDAVVLSVIGSIALIVGLATCDIVAAIRERKSPDSPGS